jgi:putative transposase
MDTADRDMWHWYHNLSECYYHIQLTIKYRRAVLTGPVQAVIVSTLKDFKEHYAIEITELGFDQNHIHLLCRFLPKYSGGQVIRLIKSMTAKQVFAVVPAVKKQLWGGEFWTDGYYIATISGHGNKAVIENYIQNQGRAKDIAQLKLFEL